MHQSNDPFENIHRIFNQINEPIRRFQNLSNQIFEPALAMQNQSEYITNSNIQLFENLITQQELLYKNLI